MNIIIKRTQSIKHFVEGHLYIDENLICDTLENSRSCLSSGIYAIRITKCKQHRHWYSTIRSCSSSVGRSRWEMGSMVAMMAAS